MMCWFGSFCFSRANALSHQVRDPNSFYLNDKRQVRIQIEWGESYLLFQATYHKYDDVTRMHNFQMR